MAPMGLTRQLLRPVAHLAGRHADRQAAEFLDAHRRSAAVQDELLRELIDAHAGTAFGRDHGFDSVRTWRDFTRAVPVRSYDGLRPYMDRVLAGETTALLPDGEDVLMFSMTSGTTGRPKHIPVTRRFLADIRRGWNVFGMRALRDHPDAWLRPILQISSPMRETTSPTGLPCGAISGLLAETQKRIVRRMYPVPRAVFAAADPAAKYYAILRCGVPRDVAIITTANPSSTIKLIETGQAHAERLVRDVADGTLTPPGELPGPLRRRLRFRRNPALAARMNAGIERDGELRPGHFWNVSLLTNWTGGTLGLYLPRLRELFAGSAVRDIGLLASEGRFSVPLADDTPAGVAEITGNVLEFIPAAERDAGGSRTLRPHEAEPGEEYFLVVTNRAGLWRYDMDDRVRVVDRLGGSPVFEFLSRGRHTANITGEKLTEHQVVEAMRRAAGGGNGPVRGASTATGLGGHPTGAPRPDTATDVERFVLQGRFAATPYYELRTERRGRAEDAARLAERFDAALCELNIEYASKRRSGRLGPVRPTVLPPGELAAAEAEAIRQRSGRAEQYKHQYLSTEVIDESKTGRGSVTKSPEESGSPNGHDA